MRVISASGTSALAGLALGVALDISMAWLARSGPAGDGWSFRGNGALVVPIGFGAAVLAAGWLGISLFGRGVRGWLGLAVAIGAGAAAPALLSVLVLVLVGRDAQSGSDLLTIPAFAWPVLSLALAVALQLRPPAARRLHPVLTLLAGVAFTLALGVGFFGAEVVLPQGSA